VWRAGGAWAVGRVARAGLGVGCIRGCVDGQRAPPGAVWALGASFLKMRLGI
jgi:hypothetical protein